jgi:hypothetical protein
VVDQFEVQGMEGMERGAHSSEYDPAELPSGELIMEAQEGPVLPQGIDGVSQRLRLGNQIVQVIAFDDPVANGHTQIPGVSSP